MNDGLKQRLIGAIVLLALAVIFVPVIFDREQLQPVDRQTQIPAAPEVTPISVPEPRPPAEVEGVPPLDEPFMPEQEPEDSTIESPPEEVSSADADRPQLNPQGVPEAWTLQIASYRSPERADEMHQQLIKHGYTAYTRTVRSEQGELTRVFVGPKLDKRKLIEDQQAIEEKYQLSTLILKFKP